MMRYSKFEKLAGRIIWGFCVGLGALMSLCALGSLGFYLVFSPEINPLMVGGLLALACMMPMFAVGSLLPVVGLFVLMGRTRPGVGALRHFAQGQGLELQYPTLLSPNLATGVVLADGSVVQSRASRVEGPHLVFFMTADRPSSFHLGPGGPVTRALRKALVGDADVVSLEGTYLTEGWRCMSPERERARQFVMSEDKALEALLTEARGAKGWLEFTTDDSLTGASLTVLLPASYDMPDNLVSVTLERMRALKARWSHTAQAVVSSPLSPR